MIFDAIRRLFGANSRPPEDHQSTSSQIDLFRARPPAGDAPPHPFHRPPSLDVFDMDTDMNRIHKFMENQMRSMMESFNFMFGSPMITPDPEPRDGDNYNHARGGFFPFSFGIPGLPRSGGGLFDNRHESDLHMPALPGPEGNLEPRDEVLKPHFRKDKLNEKKDVDLDALVERQGPGIVTDFLKPNQTDQKDIFSPFSWSWSGSFEPQVSSSSSVTTIYRNINGHSTYEKIVRHPDGRVDRTVIENDGASNHPLPPVE